ncbi:early endosome antigen 1-like [Mugil cephalus]|uniref:early endosome antigen 1-like n=1 Tax=Mugil cephalus TaxID=48193 RepID=UPI001FB6DB97|nr:early endosome antigen 1-like [Mugil cephalus]
MSLKRCLSALGTNNWARRLFCHIFGWNEKNTQCEHIQELEETIFSQEEQVAQLSAKLESVENERQSLWIQMEELTDQLKRANLCSEELSCLSHKERQRCLKEEEQTLRIGLQQQVEETNNVEALRKDAKEMNAQLQRVDETIFLQEEQVSLESEENKKQSLRIHEEDLTDNLVIANIRFEEQISLFHKERERCLKEEQQNLRRLQQQVEETKNLGPLLKYVNEMNDQHQKVEETSLFQKECISELSANLQSQQYENKSLCNHVEYLIKELHGAKVYSEEQRVKYLKEKSLRIKLQQVVEETGNLEAQLKDVEGLDTLLQRAEETIFLQEKEISKLSAKLQSKENENQSLWIKFEGLKDKLELANVHSEEQKSQFNKEREKCIEEEQSLRIKLQQQVEESKKLEAQLKDAEELEALLQRAEETIFSQEAWVCQLSAKLESNEKENQSLWIKFEVLKDKLELVNVHSEEQKNQFHKEREKCLEEEQSLRIKLQQQVEETKKLEAQLKVVEELDPLLQRAEETIFSQEGQVCQLSAKLESKENENQSLWIQVEDLKDKLERANVHSEEQKSQFHKEREKCQEEEQSLRIKLQQQLEQTKKLEAQLKVVEELDPLLQRAEETISLQEEQVSQLSAELELKENENQSLWIKFEGLKDKLERANVHSEEQKSQFHKEREKYLEEEQSHRIKLQQQVEETKKLEAQLKDAKKMNAPFQRVKEISLFQKKYISQLSAHLDSEQSKNKALYNHVEYLTNELHGAKVYSEEQGSKYLTEKALRIKLQQQVEKIRQLEAQFKDVDEMNGRGEETIFLPEELVSQLSAKLESLEKENKLLWIKLKDLTNKLVHSEEQKRLFNKEREKCLDEEQSLRITLQQQVDETQNLEALRKEANEMNAQLQRVEDISLFQKEHISQLYANLESEQLKNKTLWNQVEHLTNELHGAKVYSGEQRAKYLKEQSLRFNVEKQLDESRTELAHEKSEKELLMNKEEETRNELETLKLSHQVYEGSQSSRSW